MLRHIDPTTLKLRLSAMVVLLGLGTYLLGVALGWVEPDGVPRLEDMNCLR